MSLMKHDKGPGVDDICSIYLGMLRALLMMFISQNWVGFPEAKKLIDQLPPEFWADDQDVDLGLVQLRSNVIS